MTTTGKATALTLGLVGVIAFGVWVAPQIVDRTSSPSTMTEPATPAADQAAATPDTTGAPKLAPRRTAPAESTSASAKAEPAVPKLSPQTPELLDRLQPLLNRGADMRIASDGF